MITSVVKVVFLTGIASVLLIGGSVFAVKRLTLTQALRILLFLSRLRQRSLN